MSQGCQEAVLPVLLPNQETFTIYCLQSFPFCHQDAHIGPPIKLCFVSKSTGKVMETYIITFSAPASNIVEKKRNLEVCKVGAESRVGTIFCHV